MCSKKKSSISIAASRPNRESKNVVVFYIFFLLFTFMCSFVYTAIFFFLLFTILILYTTGERLTLQFSLGITEFSVEFPLNFSSN